VRDKALLSELAVVLQQMDSSIFSSSEAVQEVAALLNTHCIDLVSWCMDGKSDEKRRICFAM